MRQIKRLTSLTAIVFFAAAAANAQATRTWVSGVGDDANPCSRTAPCETFAGAFSKTAAGGEIDVLEPGDFGALTITNAITIDGGGALEAGVRVTSGNAITVNAGSSDVVALRNLSLQGLRTATAGIRLTSAKALHVEHCTMTQFSNGIDLEPTTNPAQVFISDTISQDNSNAGLLAIGAATPYLQVSLDNSRFDNNVNGVVAGGNTRFSIRNSAASGNSGVGFLANPDVTPAVVSIAGSTAGNNGTGIQSGGGTGAASVRVSGVSLFLNTNGFVTGTNGAIASFGNNSNSGSGAPNSLITVQ